MPRSLTLVPILLGALLVGSVARADPQHWPVPLYPTIGTYTQLAFADPTAWTPGMQVKCVAYRNQTAALAEVVVTFATPGSREARALPSGTTLLTCGTTIIVIPP